MSLKSVLLSSDSLPVAACALRNPLADMMSKEQHSGRKERCYVACSTVHPPAVSSAMCACVRAWQIHCSAPCASVRCYHWRVAYCQCGANRSPSP